jgi:hypothetical protein
MISGRCDFFPKKKQPARRFERGGLIHKTKGWLPLKEKVKFNAYGKK